MNPAAELSWGRRFVISLSRQSPEQSCEECHRLSIRNLFSDSNKSRKGPDEGPAETIEDLIVLERYAEAEQRLKARLKANASDQYARLKLAEVYSGSKQFDKAVEEYTSAASDYAGDGFYDKAQALLSKAIKLRPLDEGLKRRAESYDRAKRLEKSRVAAVEGMRSSGQTDSLRLRAAMEIQQIWQQLSGCNLVSKLPNEQVKRLFAAFELVKLGAGSLVVERGSTLPQMALIGRGLVEAVVPRRGGGDHVIRSFGAGDLIGEGALLEHRPWPATYRAAEQVTLLTLSRESLEQMLQGNPDPRGFLTILREQRNDHAVAYAVHQMGTA